MEECKERILLYEVMEYHREYSWLEETECLNLGNRFKFNTELELKSYNSDL